MKGQTAGGWRGVFAKNAVCVGARFWEYKQQGIRTNQDAVTD
jgi:hypothetical protein